MKDDDKENLAESCCFVCKDGGDLLICDYKDCLKCYHPFCVDKDDSFLQSDEDFVCKRHACFRCPRSSIYLYCYTCKKSVCRQCHSHRDVYFFQIKGKYGFCDSCLDFVLLIEENKDYDPDVGKVDFMDTETVEHYFVPYYKTIKDKEGFDLRDLYAAKERVERRKEHQSTSGIEEYEEEEEERKEKDSDFEDSDYESENTSKRNKCTIKSYKKGDEEKVEEDECPISVHGGTNELHGKVCWRRKKSAVRSSKKNKEKDKKEEEEKEYLISNHESTNDEGKCKRLHGKVSWRRKKSTIRSKKKYEDAVQKEEEEEHPMSDYEGTNDEGKRKRLHEKVIWKRNKSAIRSNKMTVTDEKTDHGNTPIVPPENGHAPDSELEHQNICSTKNSQPSADHPKEKKLLGDELEETRSQETRTGQRDSKIEVIEVADSGDEVGNPIKFDDENGKRRKFDDIESDRWCVRAPYGDFTDKCSLSILKDWIGKTSYASKFKVWRDDEDEDNAIWLLEALSFAFSKKSK